MNRFLFFCILVSVSAPAQGQWTQGLGAAAGEGSASLRYEWRTDLSRRISAGGGLRYTRIDKSQGITLGRSREWTVDRVDLHAANVFVAAAFKISDDFSLGMNLDLAGYTSGSKRRLRSPSGAVYEGEAVANNAFLVAINDRGTLNSEFFAAYHWSPRWTLRTGLSHQVVEYKANFSGAPRLQRFYDLFFVGVDLGW